MGSPKQLRASSAQLGGEIAQRSDAAFFSAFAPGLQVEGQLFTIV
jgi:hypothetical protein